MCDGRKKSRITSLSLRKHAYSNILRILPLKTENFQMKNSGCFLISAQNIDCGYSLEPPRRGGSNEYPQCMFLSRNKKNNVCTCKPQFYYIKVGFKEVNIKECFRDVVQFYLLGTTELISVSRKIEFCCYNLVLGSVCSSEKLHCCNMKSVNETETPIFFFLFFMCSFFPRSTFKDLEFNIFFLYFLSKRNARKNILLSYATRKCHQPERPCFSVRR